jgi:hypothetical protein
MQTGTPEQAPTRHRLLPHERWLADYGARRGPAPHGTQRWRMQQNYGPEGMALLGAAYANFLPGSLVGMTGLTATTFFKDSLPVFGWLELIGFLPMLVALARAVQASRAGRSFRAGRPFMRR